MISSPDILRCSRACSPSWAADGSEWHLWTAMPWPGWASEPPWPATPQLQGSLCLPRPAGEPQDLRGSLAGDAAAAAPAVSARPCRRATGPASLPCRRRRCCSACCVCKALQKSHRTCRASLTGTAAAAALPVSVSGPAEPLQDPAGVMHTMFLHQQPEPPQSSGVLPLCCRLAELD